MNDQFDKSKLSDQYIREEIKSAKGFRNFVIVILAAIPIIGATYFVDRYSLSKEIETTVTHQKDSILTIGIIGDSWVSNQKLDSLISFGVSTYPPYFNKNVVISSGEPGAKSKKIYENLCSNTEILEKADFCIVIAGVNDVIVNMGTKYYSHHIRLITKKLLSCGVEPIIVPVPDFGVNETRKRLNIISKLRNHITYLLVGKKEPADYRVSIEGIDKAYYVDFAGSYKTNPELYANPSHLSHEGNIKLRDAILTAH